MEGFGEESNLGMDVMCDYTATSKIKEYLKNLF